LIFIKWGKKKDFRVVVHRSPTVSCPDAFFFIPPPPQDWANVLYGAGAITLNVISFKEGRRLVGKNKIK
jgi:hypothetical protein